MLKLFVPLQACLFVQLFLPIIGMITIEKSSFDDDYCETKCGNITHTLCANERAKALCRPFQLYNLVDEDDDYNFLKILIEGHNGLRNRIADRMNVTSMLELTWDERLAEMAENYLLRCVLFEADPCTLISNIIREQETFNQFYISNKTSPEIVQNSYFEASSFYPYKFLERTIRAWYFEKEFMNPPNYKIKNSEFVGRLYGENNFTHFAYPFCHRFGCAMAKLKGGFHMVCNYYPYFRTLTNVMYFSSGDAHSNCPPHFPLQDHKFSNLCTQDVEDFFNGSINIIHQNLIILSSLLNVFLLLV